MNRKLIKDINKLLADIKYNQYVDGNSLVPILHKVLPELEIALIAKNMALTATPENMENFIRKIQLYV